MAINITLVIIVAHKGCVGEAEVMVLEVVMVVMLATVKVVLTVVVKVVVMMTEVLAALVKMVVVVVMWVAMVVRGDRSPSQCKVRNADGRRLVYY